MARRSRASASSCCQATASVGGTQLSLATMEATCDTQVRSGTGAAVPLHCFPSPSHAHTAFCKPCVCLLGTRGLSPSRHRHSRVVCGAPGVDACAHPLPSPPLCDSVSDVQHSCVMVLLGHSCALTTSSADTTMHPGSSNPTVCPTKTLHASHPTTVTYDDNNESVQMHLYQQDYIFLAEDNAGV